MKKTNKICYCCGSSKTYTDNLGYEHWHKNHDHENNVLCEKCDKQLDYEYNILEYKRRNSISNKKWNPITNKKSHPINNPRRLSFKGKTILLKENPRKGICKKCGKVRLTDIHHEKYHDDDPLKDTQELCKSCHSKRSWELGQNTLKIENLRSYKKR